MLLVSLCICRFNHLEPIVRWFGHSSRCVYYTYIVLEMKNGTEKRNHICSASDGGAYGYAWAYGKIFLRLKLPYIQGSSFLVLCGQWNFCWLWGQGGYAMERKQLVAWLKVFLMNFHEVWYWIIREESKRAVLLVLVGVEGKEDEMDE